MTKYEKIFNGLLTPIKVSNSLYKCETFLYSRTLEEKQNLFKRFKYWTTSLHPKDLQFGEYFLFEKGDNEVIVPTVKCPLYGNLAYIGNGVAFYDIIHDKFYSRSHTHNDFIKKMIKTHPRKYYCVIIDWGIPKIEAQNMEAMFICWAKEILGKKKNVKKFHFDIDEMINKKKEDIETIQFYLNIPESNYVDK